MDLPIKKNTLKSLSNLASLRRFKLPSKKLLFLQLILLTALLTPISSYSEANFKDDAKYWTYELEDYTKFLQLRLDFAKSINKVAEDEKNYFLKDIKYIKLLETNIEIFLGDNMTNPYMYRIIASECTSMIKAFNKYYYFLLDLQELDKKIQHELNKALKAINNYEEYENIPPREKKSLDELKQEFLIVNDIILQRKEIVESYIKETQHYLGKFQSLYKNNIQKNAFKRLKNYFFNKNYYSYRVEFWSSIYQFGIPWMKISYHELMRRLPSQAKDYLVLLAALIIFRIIIYFILKYIIKRILAKTAKLESLNVIMKPIGWLLVALSFSATDMVLMLPARLIIYRVAIILYVKAALELNCSLCQINKRSNACSSYFTPYFYLFAVTLIMQEMNIAPSLFLLTWGILLVVCFSAAILHSRRTSCINRLSLRFLLPPYLIVLFIINLFGYLYLSIFLFLMLFIIALGVKVGINLSYRLKNIAAVILKNCKRQFIAILIESLIRTTVWAVILFFIYYWTANQILDPSLVFDQMQRNFMLFGVSINALQLLYLVILLFIFNNLIKVSKASINEYAQMEKFDQGFAETLSVIIFYLVWIVYILILFRFFDVTIVGFIIASGGLGIGLGYGLKDVANNFFCGLGLVLSKKVIHGDIIEIEGTYGKVIKIDIGSTSILDIYNNMVFVHNSSLFCGNLVNYHKKVEAKINIGISYASDIKKASSELDKIGRENELIRTWYSFARKFDDSSINLIYVITISNFYNYKTVTSDVISEINLKFKEVGIEIAYPQLDLHVRHNNSLISNTQ